MEPVIQPKFDVRLTYASGSVVEYAGISSVGWNGFGQLVLWPSADPDAAIFVEMSGLQGVVATYGDAGDAH